MTPTGGANGLGTIYALHAKSNGSWAFRVIHTFTGGSDGSSGSAGKLLLRGGHIYGAATTGGANGAGVVFELTPTRSGEWGFNTLYSFKGAPDGVFPYGALLFDAAGISTARLTTAERMAWAQFTNCRPAALGSGAKRCSTASKQGAMGTARSAILWPMQPGIFMGQQAKVDWEVARFSN